MAADWQCAPMFNGGRAGRAGFAGAATTGDGFGRCVVDSCNEQQHPGWTNGLWHGGRWPAEEALAVHSEHEPVQCVLDSGAFILRDRARSILLVRSGR